MTSAPPSRTAASRPPIPGCTSRARFWTLGKIARPRTCDILAEILTERGDLRGALEWATVGVEHCIQRDDDAELQLLLRLRYRIRVDLGLDEDDYDKMLDGSRG